MIVVGLAVLGFVLVVVAAVQMWAAKSELDADTSAIADGDRFTRDQ